MAQLTCPAAWSIRALGAVCRQEALKVPGLEGGQGSSQARAICLTCLKVCLFHSTHGQMYNSFPKIAQDPGSWRTRFKGFRHFLQRGSHYFLGGIQGLEEEGWVVSLHTPSQKPVFSQTFIVFCCNSLGHR